MATISSPSSIYTARLRFQHYNHHQNQHHNPPWPPTLQPLQIYYHNHDFFKDYNTIDITATTIATATTINTTASTIHQQATAKITTTTTSTTLRVSSGVS